MKQKRIFNKSIALVIASLVMLTILTSCKDSKDAVFVNKQYGDSGMKTISNSNFDYTNGVVSNNVGFGFTLPQAMKDLVDSENFSYVGSGNSVIFMYLSEKITEADNSNASEEEQMEDTINDIIPCFAISRITANDVYGEGELERLNSLFSHVDPITTVGEDTYYFAYNDDYSEITPTDVDTSNIEKLLSVRESLKNSICLFPAEIEKMSSDVNMNNFSTKTLNGDVFTQENLAEYDLTMVNVWTTWCGPCIQEMPDLQKLYEMLPDNVNMITICADGNEESELAKQIMEELGCTFQVLYPNEQLEQSLLKEVTGYPTTVFFDRNGNIVGDSELGVPGKNPAEKYLQMIEERLGDTVVETGVTGK
ncbi:Thiol-disulfide isomerase or thioredoxin [Anaerovirgula multivorans]|uniref:Thiol-disulfide isomerase or thioredoxin n=1 Tax=Anaerovirgula multivorans TaxID=312168 RepID=A0A239KPE5_9FIRM|nr:TlpA disulfide reductase family protein [Anaerovirgula multivorans]SNT19548.1 Thiol-disulfide isomerase or thioredoxin [Anaerovirgula multivorans]